jgi:hypothetical protein
MNTEDYEWLGIVYPEDVRETVVFITPLAYYDEDKWNPVFQDENFYYFPNNGKVSVFTKHFPTAKVGQLCTFFPVQNPRLSTSEETRYSLYMTKGDIEFSPLAQIFDWTNRVSHCTALIDILEKGIDPEICFTQHIYIRYHNNLYGPIPLRYDRISKRVKPQEYIESSDTGGPSFFVSEFPLSNDGIIDLGSFSHSNHYLDERFLDSPLERKDWSLPQVVMKRVLQASNEHIKNHEDTVRLVDKRIRELTRLSSLHGPPAVQIEQVTLERARYIVERQLNRLHDLNTFIEDLAPDHPLLKRAYNQAIQQRSAEIDQEIEAQIQAKQAYLQQLSLDIQEDEIKLQRLQEDAGSAEKRRDHALAIETEMQKQIEKLRKEQEITPVELHLSASQFPALNENGHLSTSAAASLPRSTSITYASDQFAVLDAAIIWQEEEAVVTRSGGLRNISKEEWDQVARLMKAKLGDVQICVSALMAGLVPSVTGGAASSLMRAFAHMITGDRIWFVPVPVISIAPLDLFGAIDHEQRMFIPVAGGLADIVLEAQKHPEELALVVLEGIDRVPGLPVYVPLLRQYRESRQGIEIPSLSSPINLFHPRAIDVQDPYSRLARFRWPDNILLAVTCDDDMYSLPTPSICDPWFVYLEASERKLDAHSQSTSVSVASHVSLNGWRGWQQEIQHGTAQPPDVVKQLTWQQQIFYNALAILNVPKKDEVIKGNWPKLFTDETDQ